MAELEEMTKTTTISSEVLLQAYRLMTQARSMSDLYEEKRKITEKYVHACSRGHEAIQLAAGLLLKPCDFLSAYYRDDSILLGIGMEPFELMLQLLAKKNDPFSGGRTYYCHPSLRRDDMPKIPHQSSATGMQAIPATGVAMGIQYLEQQGLTGDSDDSPLVICSIGDAAITEGEVSEAFHMATLKQMPIIFLVQDNEWDISANKEEIHFADAVTYAKAFPGIEVRSIEGNDFFESFSTMQEVVEKVRTERRPFMVHAKVPLLGHHTSGVRKEWYRDDLEEAEQRDPLPKFRQQLIDLGIEASELDRIYDESTALVASDFERAMREEDPDPESLTDHYFAPTPITEELGEREPADKEPALMVDCALFAVKEILAKHPESLLYGQDVGGRLGGVFREAATLAQTFGDDRVFNTPIQEAFIIGSTVGMAAAGAKPIVEVQFADYIWPGLNQLFTELSRSYYLSNGKWPASAVIRVPIGAYGSGGPYHSSSVESILCNIRGIKVAYPSNGADLKGLMKSAYYDPNPVVILEHKGLYWSKLPGTEKAKTIEPSEDYVIPFGKARTVLSSKDENSVSIITYGRGVYWALEAAENFKNKVEIIDLRTLSPIDFQSITDSVAKNGKCLIVTEEPVDNGFAQALLGKISAHSFELLDAPLRIIGSTNVPAIPLNSTLEGVMLPNAEKVSSQIQWLLDY